MCSSDLPSFHLSNYQLSKQRYFVVCPLTFYRQRTSRTVPERISALAVTLGVCHERRCQLQDILFAVQIGKRVIVHGLVEIDRVENLDSVICMHKCMANLEQGRTFRVSEHIGTMKLEQIWLNPEPCLTGTGAADDQNILVSGVGRILRPVAHHQPLCLCEDHIVRKNRVDEGFDILCIAP